jgi:hypothetical protein
MSSPITQRVRSSMKQTAITDEKGKLVYKGEAPVAGTSEFITKSLGATHSGPDGGNKYVTDMTAERDARQPGMDLNEYMSLKDRQNAQAGNPDFQGTEDGVNVDATQWTDENVNFGNNKEEITTPGTEGTPDTDVYLKPESKTNLSRAAAGNQKRTQGMVERSTRRDANRYYRQLKRTNRKNNGLSEEQQKDFDYLKTNRKTMGSSKNFKRDDDGNITGSNNEDLITNKNHEVGYTEQTSGTEGGVTHSTEVNKARTGYKQKSYSGFQQNPDSPKKGLGNLIGKVIKGTLKKSTKVKPKQLGTGSNLPAVVTKPGVNAGAVATGGSFLGKAGNMIKGLGKAGIFGVGGVIGAGLVSALSGSSNETPKVKEKKIDNNKKTPYVKPGGKATGRMKDYALNSKARSDEYDARGWKHDATSRYKRTPKPAVNTLKSQPIVKVGGGSEIKAQPLLNKVAPVAAPVSAPIDNKQKKAIKKIGKLEGRNQTSKRDIRIAKQKDKAAGLSRKQVKANKLTRKSGGTVPSAGSSAGSSSTVTMPRVMNSAQYNQAKNLGGGSAIDAVKSGAVTIESRENELKAATGFKQKGWKGFQK